MNKYRVIMCLIWVMYVVGAPPLLISLKPCMDIDYWRLLTIVCFTVYGSVTVVTGLIAIGLHAQLWNRKGDS